jgi:hypothetical protein
MSSLLSGRVPFALLVSLWLAALTFVLPLATEAVHVSAAPPGAPVELAGPCDFAAFWAAGRMAAAGNPAGAYDPAQLLPVEAANPPAHRLQLLWYYPPPTLLLARAAQAPAFFPALFIWIGVLAGLAVFILRFAGLPWPVIAAGLLSPASLLNTNLGQLGSLSGALFLAGLVLTETRPGAAGVLFGALIIKPQAGFLAPILLLARGRWAGLAAGALSAGLLAAIALICFGAVTWRAFFAFSPFVSHVMLVEAFPHHAPPVAGSDELYGTSVFWMVRSFGGGLRISALAQGAASLAAALACWAAWRRPNADPIARAALTTCLALAIAPYGYVYDMCATSLAFAALAHQERRLHLVDALIFTWPVISLIIAFHFFLELTPLVLLLAAWRAARALGRLA